MSVLHGNREHRAALTPMFRYVSTVHVRARRELHVRARREVHDKPRPCTWWSLLPTLEYVVHGNVRRLVVDVSNAPAVDAFEWLPADGYMWARCKGLERLELLGFPVTSQAKPDLLGLPYGLPYDAEVLRLRALRLTSSSTDRYVQDTCCINDFHRQPLQQLEELEDRVDTNTIRVLMVSPCGAFFQQLRHLSLLAHPTRKHLTAIRNACPQLTTLRLDRGMRQEDRRLASQWWHGEDVDMLMEACPALVRLALCTVSSGTSRGIDVLWSKDPNAEVDGADANTWTVTQTPDPVEPSLQGMTLLTEGCSYEAIWGLSPQHASLIRVADVIVRTPLSILSVLANMGERNTALTRLEHLRVFCVSMDAPFATDGSMLGWRMYEHRYLPRLSRVTSQQLGEPASVQSTTFARDVPIPTSRPSRLSSSLGLAPTPTPAPSHPLTIHNMTTNNTNDTTAPMHTTDDSDDHVMAAASNATSSSSDGKDAKRSTTSQDYDRGDRKGSATSDTSLPPMSLLDLSSGGGSGDGKDGKEQKRDEPVKGLDLLDDTEILTLESGDGEKQKVSKRIAIQSELIKTMSEGDKDSTEIPLPNVKAAILTHVVKFLAYNAATPFKEIEKPLKSADMKELTTTWHADFVDVDKNLLFELILAANYMDIKPMLDLCCAKVASMMKGKTPEQIRATFNITNDFTPEEEATVAAENKWAEEN